MAVTTKDIQQGAGMPGQTSIVSCNGAMAKDSSPYLLGYLWAGAVIKAAVHCMPWIVARLPWFLVSKEFMETLCAMGDYPGCHATDPERLLVHCTIRDGDTTRVTSCTMYLF